MEREVEVLHHLRPTYFALANFIELLFDVSRKLVVHDFIKMLIEKIRNGHTNIRGKKPVFYSTGDLSLRNGGDLVVLQIKYLIVARFAFPILARHIASYRIHDFRNSRSVSGRSSDT